MVKAAAKLLPILFAKVSVSPIVSAQSIDIDVDDNICEYH